MDSIASAAWKSFFIKLGIGIGVVFLSAILAFIIDLTAIIEGPCMGPCDFRGIVAFLFFIAYSIFVLFLFTFLGLRGAYKKNNKTWLKVLSIIFGIITLISFLFLVYFLIRIINTAILTQNYYDAIGVNPYK